MQKTHSVSGLDLEVEVAALLDKAKWKVSIEQAQEGIQVDLAAKTPEGREVIVECKAYTRLAGLRTVREFASTVEYLREKNPDLEAWLVTTQGFTPNAQRALDRHRLVGHTIGDLRRQFPIGLEEVRREAAAWSERSRQAREKHRRVFAIMPFSDAMLDVFIFGIRWAANELGAVAERADDLEHNGEVTIQGVQPRWRSEATA